MKTSHLNYMELVSKYHVPRNILNSEMITNFHLSDKILNCLEFYRITHMSGDIFKRISHSGLVTYTRLKRIKPECSIIYHNCTRAQAIAATEIRISFRAAKEEYNLPAYAMVQIVSV